MLPNTDQLLERLRELHNAMRDALHAHLQQTAIEVMSAATEVRGGDTIYALDTSAEEVLLEFCEQWGREIPFLLVAEGLNEEQSTLGPGRQLFGCSQVEDAQFIMIVDPIDGTRPLMYDKRSAWILSAIAPNMGDETNLTHIEIAMQTELPTTKMLWADQVWAIRGQGAHGLSYNLITGDTRPTLLRPSQATSVSGGFAMFCKFFTGSKGWLAAMEEELIMEVLGPPPAGQPQTFDDQYISNAGQLFDLMTGRDRFNAELRPLAHEILHGDASSHLCSHPYDLCGELIAREAGVIVTDENGEPLSSPLDVHSPVSWIAYANREIQQEIEPTLLRLIRERRAAKQ
jgi:fructose-1,6-bisphosphatase/inositol monophosphatase family enzyme